MKTRLFTLLAVFGLVVSSCYDDTELRSQLADHEERIYALEQLCDRMNTNIEALQTIVTALQDGDYITSVTPIHEGGVEIGYVIELSKSGSITVFHGKDGADGAPGQDGQDGQDGADGKDGVDGVAPIIGVKQDTDGLYYWTLNGEWLLDANGNMVRASGYDGADGENGQPGAPGQDGEDGKDGQDGADGEPGAPGQDGADGKDGAPGQDGEDGITPRLKIEDDYWYVSYDNGLTWELLGKAVGEDGKDGVDGADGKDGENGFVSDAVFESVQVTATAVKFVLPDGQTFEIPMFQKAALIFDLENQEVPIRAGETIRLSYRLENSNASTVVSASSDGNYKACVIPKDHTKGIIEITSPAVYVDGFINVIVTDGENYSYVKVINVYEKGMHFVNGYEYAVPSQGRHLRIPFSVNFGYSVQVDGESQSWVSLVETKASYMDDQIDLIISRNDQTAARRGVVYVYADNNRNEPYTKIIINQESAVFGLEKTTFVAAAAGETLTNVVVSTSGLYFDESQLPGWLDVSFTLRDDERTHDVTMNVAKNVSTQNRSCTITCYADDKTTVVGEMKLVQLANDKDLSKDMVLKVRTNFANDFTTILPIAADTYYITDDNGVIQDVIYSNVDCYVDWGDGMVEHIVSELRKDQWGNTINYVPEVKHRYEGLTEPKTFEVRISGLVEIMSANRENTFFNPAQSSITEVVQWGNLGVKDMSGAFYNNVTLKKIPSDRMYSFSEVENFSNAFTHCTSLEEIPENLFVSAKKAKYFDFCFENCSSVKLIPANLFASCESATSFEQAFYNCTSLMTISPGVFANLSKVKSFNYCFANCSKLKNIPEGLFSGCTSVESFYNCLSGCGFETLPIRLFEDCVSVVDFANCFSGCATLKELPIDLFNYSPNISTVAYCFYSCLNLSSIPVSLFDNNRRITDFKYCFYECLSIDMESPYTVINGKKWHLYERAGNPDLFVAPVNYYACFRSSTFTDMDQIPDAWK